MEAAQRATCAAHGAAFFEVPLDHKAGVAGNVVPGAVILNGLRHPPEAGTTGWYLWAGEQLRSDDDFFEPLHLEHLIDRCPAVLKYLGLAPGWRFLCAPDYEDVWFDPALLEVEK